MLWVWLLLILILLVLLTLYSAYKSLSGNEDYWSKQGIFSVKNSEIFSFWDGILFRIPFHLHHHLVYQKMKAKNKFAKAGGVTFFGSPSLLVLDLDLARRVLVKDFDSFTNRSMVMNDPELNLMLSMQVNQPWKELRTSMTPTFTTGKLKRMFSIFNESGRKMTAHLRRKVQEAPDAVDIQDATGRYTMDVIASAAFGVDSQNFESENSPFAENGRKMQFKFDFKNICAFVLNKVAPKLAGLFEVSILDKDASAFMEGVVRDSIKRRKETGEKRDDFLQLLLEAQSHQLTQHDDQAENNDHVLTTTKKYEMTDQVLIAQCKLFFFAGFDTVESLLTWTSYELALHPEIQDRLFDELKEVDDLNYDTVTQLKYLDMVISESLRKYSAGVRLDRVCNRDYEVDSDLTIKKDTNVVVPMYAIHHDPEIFPNPDQFNPERFTVENKAARHPYAYMPFGLGPRSCIAMRFAILEGKAAIANLVLNFRLSPCKKTDIPEKFSSKGILKPLNGMWLKLEPRD